MVALQSIFLSYRRSDAVDAAGRIFADLAGNFGERRIFKDVNSIPVASEYWPVICNHIRQSVVTVLIGPRWLETMQDRQHREVDDYVKMEIETALTSGVPVVPTLVTNAAMPLADDLPPSIRALASLHAIHIRPDPDYTNDMRRFIECMEAYVPREVAQPLPSAAFLDDLQSCCQNWHNEIVTTLAKIMAVTHDPNQRPYERAIEIERINFVYQNTRSFLPKLLSARRTLASLSDSDRLARALDEFLDLVIASQGDHAQSSKTHGYDSSVSGQPFDPRCASLDLFLPKEPKPSFFDRWWRNSSAPFTLTAFGSSVASSPVGDMSQALQQICEQVAALKVLIDARQSR